jgi:hypothetical protein
MMAVKLLPRAPGSAADLAGRDLGVLARIAAPRRRGQLVALQLGRVEPDAHGVLRAEHLTSPTPSTRLSDVLQRALTR